jgi:nicotinamidase-related amidase
MPSDNKSLSGSTTAMIVVDMQNAYLDEQKRHGHHRIEKDNIAGEQSDNRVPQR